MAASDVRQDLELEVTCSLCLCVLQDPKLLSCNHIFCRSPCLESLIRRSRDNAISCPVCRAITEIPGDLHKLQTAFHVNRLKDIIKRLGIKEQVKREPTVGNKSKPDRSPDTERPDRCCGKHANQSLDLYCRQCKELTCKDCVAIDRKHSLHDYDLVSKVAPDFRRLVIDRLSAVEGIRKSVEQALQVASQTRKDIGREKADLNRDTDRLFGDHQPFDARVFTQRLSLTNRTMDNQLERVQCFEEKLQLIWSELDDLVISVHQSAFEKNDVEFLSSIADIFQHIKNICSKYVGLSKLPLKFPYSASLLNEKYAVFKGGYS